MDIEALVRVMDRIRGRGNTSILVEACKLSGAILVVTSQSAASREAAEHHGIEIVSLDQLPEAVEGHSKPVLFDGAVTERLACTAITFQQLASSRKKALQKIERTLLAVKEL